MFEKIREKVVYPSELEYQRSDEPEVSADWAVSYLRSLASKYPGAKITGWDNLRVVAEVTMTDAQILTEKLEYLKSALNNVNDPVVKEALSRI